MKKTTEYRQQAEKCRKLADKSFSAEDRAHLLEMADTWAGLAAAREEMLARYPDMSRVGAPARGQEAPRKG